MTIIFFIAWACLMTICRCYGCFLCLKKGGFWNMFILPITIITWHAYIFHFQQYIATSTCQKPQLTVNGWETEETGKNFKISNKFPTYRINTICLTKYQGFMKSLKITRTYTFIRWMHSIVNQQSTSSTRPIDLSPLSRLL